MDVYSWIRRRLPIPQKNSPPSTSSTSSSNNNHLLKENEEVEVYGITEELIEFVKSFTLDTFKNFSLPEEEGGNGTSGNVSNDLSKWQERHAMLVLSKVKELSQLRFRLCPGYLKERLFWRIYFTLVRTYITEYELHAIRLAKLQEMTLHIHSGTEAASSAIEVEMSEARMTNSTMLAGSSEDI